MSIQAISARAKRDALAEVVQEHLQDAFGQQWRTYTEPSVAMLNIRSNRTNLEIMRNDAGRVQMLSVYWLGTSDADVAPGGAGRELVVQGNRKLGAVDSFRVTMHYEYDPDAGTYDEILDIAAGIDPDGVIRFLNKAPAIQLDSGETAILSTVTNVVVPPVPQPLTGDASGRTNTRAHLVQFEVALTDN